MEFDNEKTPLSIGSIEDAPFKLALKKYPALLARLDGVNFENGIDAYDEIIDAVKRAAVDDGAGELVVFDIEGYEEGYEDEQIEAKTPTLKELVDAIEFVKANKGLSYEEVREKIKHIPVRNAVISIWSLEDKTQTDE